MTVSEDATLWVAGGSAAALVVRELWARFVGSSAKALDAREAQRDAAIVALTESTTKLVTTSELLKERVQGLSENHGPRLGELEKEHAVTKERLTKLEARRGAKR